MKNLVINLLEEKTEHGFMPTLTTYILDGEGNRPAVIVIPGGGYGGLSSREGERIAISYNAAGFHAFVLNYAVAPHRHPLPILNAAKAIETVRENSEKWHVSKDKIAVCGFSAGGHLSASISTLWNDKEIFGEDEEKNLLHKPNASILCYPVITSEENKQNKGSFVNLIGDEDESNPLYKKLSLENAVDGNTAPAFLFHTFYDQIVSVENSLCYASALKKNDVPFELHIFPHGEHGLALVSDETIWSVNKFNRDYPWVKLSIDWLNELFGCFN
ncbi:MAG: alpha/beta hydrolase [Clostridia bacterium]|nr:alpha/beta hydrolase [Clostridia bacterium]